MGESLSLWPLIGIAAIVVGFVLRFNPVLVVIVSGIITGLTAHMPIATILEKLGDVDRENPQRHRRSSANRLSFRA